MKKAQKLKLNLKRASPTILTCVSIVGVVSTAVSAVAATPKALKLIDKTTIEKGEELSKTEVVLATFKVYIPSFLIGMSTITCICAANILNKRQQAMITGAYTLLSNSYKEYKSKLKELYGEEAHNAIIDSIAKEQCSDVHITCPGLFSSSTLDFDEGDEPELIRTFYDNFSKRYFESTISKVIQAEYHLNRNFVLNGGDISLNSFYDFLGLEGIEDGENLGWSVNDELYWIDFDHHKLVLDDGMEIFVIDMVFEPRLYEDWD